MAFNPLNELHRRRLMRQIDWSNEELEKSRENRKEAVQRYVGSHYGDDTKQPMTPLMFMRMAVGIYRRQLVARLPRVMASTPVPELMPVAKRLELAVNEQISSREMRLGDVLKRFVTDAIFRMGIIKCGIEPYASVEFGGESNLVTRVYAGTVDYSDWVHDMNARHYDEITFASDEVRLHKSVVRDNPFFTPEAMDILDPQKGDYFGRQDASVEGLGGRGEPRPDMSTDYVRFRNIWLPREQMVIMLPSRGDPVLLAEPVEWEGPERGPYHLLAFDGVPNNILPVPPIDSVRDLHDLANSLFVKMAEQAKGQKTVLGYQAAAEQDAENIRTARNLDTIRMDNPSMVSQFSFNGASPETVASLLQTRNMFSYMGGNLDVVGGLGAQTDTVGQEQQLLASAGGMIEDMQAETVNIVKELMESIAGYLWDDLLFDPQIQRQIAGLNRSIPVSFSSEQRLGEFTDYRIDIDPYSMQPQTPQQKFQAMNTLLTQIAPVAMQLSQAGVVDFARTMKMYAGLLGVEDRIEEILQIVDHSRLPGPENTPMRQSPVTTRTNVRVNRPGATMQGQEDVMGRVLAGAGVQGSEMASLGRMPS